MYKKILVALVVTGLLAGCARSNIDIITDSRTGHFGTGLHDGRVSGR